MKIKKILPSTIMIGGILLNLAAPVVAATISVPAHGETYKTADSDYILDVSPLYNSDDGEPIALTGGEFTIKQIEEYSENGQATEVSGSPVVVDLNNDSNQVTIGEDGTYEITNSKRVPGFYKDDTVYKYAFPLVEDGLLADSQSVLFSPKLSPVLGDIEFVKVDQSNNPIEGVKFDLYQTSDYSMGGSSSVGNKVNPNNIPSNYVDVNSDNFRTVSFRTTQNYYSRLYNHDENEFITINQDEYSLNQTGGRVVSFGDEIIGASDYTPSENKIKGVATAPNLDLSIYSKPASIRFYMNNDTLDLTYFDPFYGDPNNATVQSEMFRGSNIDYVNGLSNWDISSATVISNVFYGFTTKTLDLSNWNWENIEDMSYIFRFLKVDNLILSGINAPNVTDMTQAFNFLDTPVLDLSGFDFSNVTKSTGMLTNTTATIGYAKDQENADWLNAHASKPEHLNFVVKDSSQPEFEEVKLGELTTGTEGKVTFENLNEGTYYVQETATVDGKTLNTNKIEFEVTTDESGKNVVVREIGDLDLNQDLTHGQTFINYDQAMVDKKVKTKYTTDNLYVDTTQNVESNGLINYQIELDVPNDILNYETYTITDTLDSNLTVVPESLVVTGYDWSDNEVSLSEYAVVGTESDTIQLDIQSNPELKSALDGLASVVMTYNATVETDNVSAEDVLANNVVVAWDNGSGDIGTINDTVDVQVKEGAVEVVKQDGNEDTVKLEGAEFAIYELGTGEGELSYKGETYVPSMNPRTDEQYVGTTDVEGNIIFDSIPFGDYLLVETKAPEGYRLNKSHIAFTIADTETQEIEGVEDSIRIVVDNYKQSDLLPATGTTGILISLMVGGILTGTVVTLNRHKEDEELENEEK